MIELTEDEATRMGRFVQLAKEIAEAETPEIAKQLAQEKNDWLSEGLDVGRLSLTTVAMTVRYMVTGDHGVQIKPETKRLIEDLSKLPEFQEFHSLVEKGKHFLLV